MGNLTYEEFINNILNTRGRFACGDKYHECHHIIPRCIDGTDDKENLIDLFAKEHFIAHKLLAKENPNNKGLVYAWWCMATANGKHTDDADKLTPEEYEEIRIIYSKSITGENNPMFGKTHSIEARRKISENHADVSGEHNPIYGKSRSNETKQKLSELRKGKFTGEDNPFYGKKHTEEAKQKMSEARKGKYMGEDNPFYGKTHTEETKKKLSMSNSRGKSVRARKVIRLFDLKVYDCLLDVMDENKISKSTLIDHCKRQRDFMYYDEWLKLQNELEEIDELQAV